ncbi:ribonuclease III [Sphingomonas flavalba]|uniref:ribonuclease III n=1 Tax=Sphingomonas flavalba TaxID=2559804 RepID=UPI0039E14C4F
MSGDLTGWLTGALGHRPADEALFRRALTHGSREAEDYQRLEFLGDRVLGLIVARWLYTRFADEPEGKLSRRLNLLVSGETCAEIAREIGVGPNLRLGKQARDDGAMESDHVLGDVVEALIGALYLDGGFDAADRFVRAAWGERIARERAPQHPKSALQEWAAANRRKPPVYELAGRSGPHHSPRFTVSVTIKGAGDAQAEGSSKQEAETAAARTLLALLTGVEGNEG